MTSFFRVYLMSILAAILVIYLGGWIIIKRDATHTNCVLKIICTDKESSDAGR